MLKPLRDKIVVKKLEAASSSSGIILTSDTKSSTRGEVLAVGSGRLTANGDIIPLEVKVGDVVRFAGTNVFREKVDDGEVLIMPENEVLAIE